MPVYGFSLTGIFTNKYRFSLSYRDQSIDLQSKLIDWFLYDREILSLHAKIRVGENPYSDIFYVLKLIEEVSQNHRRVASLSLDI